MAAVNWSAYLDVLDQEITGDILLELTLDSLKELDVTTFGKRFKIHNAINALRQETKKQKVGAPSHLMRFSVKLTCIHSVAAHVSS